MPKPDVGPGWHCRLTARAVHQSWPADPTTSPGSQSGRVVPGFRFGSAVLDGAPDRRCSLGLLAIRPGCRQLWLSVAATCRGRESRPSAPGVTQVPLPLGPAISPDFGLGRRPVPAARPRRRFGMFVLVVRKACQSRLSRCPGYQQWPSIPSFSSAHRAWQITRGWYFPAISPRRHSVPAAGPWHRSRLAIPPGCQSDPYQPRLPVPTVVPGHRFCLSVPGVGPWLSALAVRPGSHPALRRPCFRHRPSLRIGCQSWLTVLAASPGRRYGPPVLPASLGCLPGCPSRLSVLYDGTAACPGCPAWMSFLTLAQSWQSVLAGSRMAVWPSVSRHSAPGDGSGRHPRSSVPVLGPGGSCQLSFSPGCRSWLPVLAEPQSLLPVPALTQPPVDPLSHPSWSFGCGCHSRLSAMLIGPGCRSIPGAGPSRKSWPSVLGFAPADNQGSQSPLSVPAATPRPHSVLTFRQGLPATPAVGPGKLSRVSVLVVGPAQCFPQLTLVVCPGRRTVGAVIPGRNSQQSAPTLTRSRPSVLTASPGRQIRCRQPQPGVLAAGPGRQ